MKVSSRNQALQKLTFAIEWYEESIKLRGAQSGTKRRRLDSSSQNQPLAPYKPAGELLNKSQTLECVLTIPRCALALRRW